MLQAVLRNAPDNWEEADYRGKIFVLKDVTCTSREYKTFFNSNRVFQPANFTYKLYRVQNPFSYGRFTLWKQQQRLTISRPRFYKTNKSKLNLCIEFNYEERKTHCDFNIFFESLEECLPLYRNEVIHVLMYLTSSTKHWDKNWYPQYVISVDKLPNIHTLAISDSSDSDSDDFHYGYADNYTDDYDDLILGFNLL